MDERWMRFRLTLPPEQATEINRRFVEAFLRGFKERGKELPRPEEAEDSPELLAIWAEAVEEAMPAENLKELVADYLTIARNPRIGDEDRARALRRAQVLMRTA